MAIGKKKIKRRHFIKQGAVLGIATSISPQIIAKTTIMKNKSKEFHDNHR